MVQLDGTQVQGEPQEDVEELRDIGKYWLLKRNIRGFFIEKV
jgi:hypothetical protein